MENRRYGNPVLLKQDGSARARLKHIAFEEKDIKESWLQKEAFRDVVQLLTTHADTLALISFGKNWGQSLIMLHSRKKELHRTFSYGALTLVGNEKRRQAILFTAQSYLYSCGTGIGREGSFEN